MFGFGYGLIFLVTQMWNLGPANALAGRIFLRIFFLLIFLASLVVYYFITRDFRGLPLILSIPGLEYFSVIIMILLFPLFARIVMAVKKRRSCVGCGNFLAIFFTILTILIPYMIFFAVLGRN
jgi:hypothetical protein